MTKPSNERRFSDAFWNVAFYPTDPHLPSYSDEFRRGLTYGDEDDLAWGRLAIYALQDHAMGPVVARLAELAVDMPGAEFVESLVFYLSDEGTLGRMMPRLQASERHEMTRNINSLKVLLTSRGDRDLAQMLNAVSAALAIEPPPP